MSSRNNHAIAFVRIGSFSHINESLRSELARQFPGHDIDDVDVASLVSKADRWGWRNLSRLVKDQRWQLMAPLHRIQEVVAKTDYVFRLSSERIRRRLAAKPYAFTLQTSTLFDASRPHVDEKRVAAATALLRQLLEGTPAGELIARRHDLAGIQPVARE